MNAYHTAIALYDMIVFIKDIKQLIGNQAIYITPL